MNTKNESGFFWGARMLIRKVILAVLFLLPPIYSCAEPVSFGTLGLDDGYEKLDATELNYGALRLVVYNTDCLSIKCVYDAPDYDVYVNSKKLSTVKFGIFAMIAVISPAKLSFFNVNLPIGKYSVRLIRASYFSANGGRSTLFPSGEFANFDVLVKEQKRITVQVGGIFRQPDQPYTPSVVLYKSLPEDMVFFEESAIDNSALSEVINEALPNSEKYAKEEQSAKEEVLLSQQKAREQEELAKAEKQRIYMQEQAALQKQREEEVAAFEVQQRMFRQQAEAEKLRVDEEVSAADDKTCKSYGAEKGSQAYVMCRVQLVNNRRESAEREASIKALEARIELLQSEISQRKVTQDQRDREQQALREQELALQQAQLQEQRRQTKIRESQMWFNLANTLGQPTQGAPAPASPFSTYNIKGRTYNCTTTGSLTNCR